MLCTRNETQKNIISNHMYFFVPHAVRTKCLQSTGETISTRNKMEEVHDEEVRDNHHHGI